MAKKKNDGNPFFQMMNNLEEMVKNMGEEEKEEFERLMQGELDLPDVENKRFYTYQKPDYSKKATQVIQWLGPFWNAHEDDDKVMLCHYVESDIRIQGLSPQFMREEIRGYLYGLFAGFDPDVPENHWRLYGPLWMMERLKMTDCLDIVLESLRQDAFFFHNYFLDLVLVISKRISRHSSASPPPTFSPCSASISRSAGVKRPPTDLGGGSLPSS